MAEFGQGDASFQAAGGREGVYRLVTDFYDFMATLPEASKILRMHPQDLEESKDKLARFLCGWLGGPRLYQEKYGQISIPAVHAHLGIGAAERDAWLLCMQHAIEKQNYRDDFKSYLYQQLSIPAHRVTNQDK